MRAVPGRFSFVREVCYLVEVVGEQVWNKTCQQLDLPLCRFRGVKIRCTEYGSSGVIGYLANLYLVVVECENCPQNMYTHLEGSVLREEKKGGESVR